MDIAEQQVCNSTLAPMINLCWWSAGSDPLLMPCRRDKCPRRFLLPHSPADPQLSRHILHLQRLHRPALLQQLSGVQPVSFSRAATSMLTLYTRFACTPALADVYSSPDQCSIPSHDVITGVAAAARLFAWCRPLLVLVSATRLSTKTT